jgi:HEPN domain-containing protein
MVEIVRVKKVIINMLEDAQWHHTTGREFEEAFYILIGKFSATHNHWEQQVGRPSYYCAGLAAEHYMKGYLTLKGIGYPKNHKGHDLAHLISLDSNLGDFFQLQDSDIKEIELLNERYYSDEKYGKDDLRYGSKNGLRISPHPDSFNRILKLMAKRLSNELQRQYIQMNKETTDSVE